MKSLSMLIALLISISSFSATYWGFLNEDLSYNTCFVGLEDESLAYHGVISNRFLTREQRELMRECNEEKAKGLPHLITIVTTPDTQIQSNGVRTHFPTFEVDCVYLPEREFGMFLSRWRREVRSSNFRRCF